ncbi:hypothetical protein HDU67_003519 [Dinochytrium kinnereticum]|nr:hypothetical protein HDU67_003519 [Dinochytrium kinnereticum]
MDVGDFELDVDSHILENKKPAFSLVEERLISHAVYQAKKTGQSVDDVPFAIGKSLPLIHMDQFMAMIERQKEELMFLRTSFRSASNHEMRRPYHAEIPSYVLGWFFDNQLITDIMDAYGADGSYREDIMEKQRGVLEEITDGHTGERPMTWQLFQNRMRNGMDDPFLNSLFKVKEEAKNAGRKSAEQALLWRNPEAPGCDQGVLTLAELNAAALNDLRETDTHASVEEICALYEKSYERLRRKHEREFDEMRLRHLMEDYHLMTFERVDHTWTHEVWEGDLLGHQPVESGNRLIARLKLFSAISLTIRDFLLPNLERLEDKVWSIKPNMFSSQRKGGLRSISLLATISDPFVLSRRVIETSKFMHEERLMYEITPPPNSKLRMWLLPASLLTYRGRPSSKMDEVFKFPNEYLILHIFEVSPGAPLFMDLDAQIPVDLEDRTFKSWSDYEDCFSINTALLSTTQPVLPLLPEPMVNLDFDSSPIHEDGQPAAGPTLSSTLPTPALSGPSISRRDPRQRR